MTFWGEHTTILGWYETLENIEKEHICCAIGDKKHQAGVTQKKE